MFRRVGLAALAASAVGAPYLLSDSGLKGTLTGAFQESGDPAEADQLQARLQAIAPTANQPGVAATTAQENARLPAPTLDEILRFQDRSPQWVLSHWPRVSTIQTRAGWTGYRVAALTGTGQHDLAGSLTYYFDSRQTLQRIEFRGTTGDPAVLVHLLQQRFGFQPVSGQSAGAGLWRVHWNGRPNGELRVTPAEVIRAEAPHARYRVEALVGRPGRLPWFRDGVEGLGRLRM